MQYSPLYHASWSTFVEMTLLPPSVGGKPDVTTFWAPATRLDGHKASPAGETYLNMHKSALRKPAQGRPAGLTLHRLGAKATPNAKR